MSMLSGSNSSPITSGPVPSGRTRNDQVLAVRHLFALTVVLDDTSLCRTITANKLQFRRLLVDGDAVRGVSRSAWVVAANRIGPRDVTGPVTSLDQPEHRRCALGSSFAAEFRRQHVGQPEVVLPANLGHRPLVRGAYRECRAIAPVVLPVAKLLPMTPVANTAGIAAMVSSNWSCRSVVFNRSNLIFRHDEPCLP